jgi:hypothetical protein
MRLLYRFRPQQSHFPFFSVSLKQIDFVMRKWIHRILKGASLTTALFVFQACYGTPPGPYYDEELKSLDEMELVGQEEIVQDVEMIPEEEASVTE